MLLCPLPVLPNIRHILSIGKKGVRQPENGGKRERARKKNGEQKSQTALLRLLHKLGLNLLIKKIIII